MKTFLTIFALLTMLSTAFAVDTHQDTITVWSASRNGDGVWKIGVSTIASFPLARNASAAGAISRLDTAYAFAISNGIGYDEGENNYYDSLNAVGFGLDTLNLGDVLAKFAVATGHTVRFDSAYFQFYTYNMIDSLLCTGYVYMVPRFIDSTAAALFAGTNNTNILQGTGGFDDWRTRQSDLANPDTTACDSFAVTTGTDTTLQTLYFNAYRLEQLRGYILGDSVTQEASKCVLTLLSCTHYTGDSIAREPVDYTRYTNTGVFFVGHATNAPIGLIVKWTDIYPVLAAISDTLDFDSIQVGADSTLDISFANTGTDTATLDSVVFSGGGFSFVSDPALPQTIAPDDTLTGRTITFTPTTATAYAETAFVYYDVAAPETIFVFGVGLCGDHLTVSPDTMDFDTIYVNADSAQTLSLISYGTDTLTIDSVVCADSYFSCGFSDTTVNPLDTITVTVTYSPLADSTSGVMMYFYGDCEVSDSLWLTGVGIPAPSTATTTWSTWRTGWRAKWNTKWR